MAESPAERESAQPVAGLLAVALPGLGHAALGEARRGLLIGAGVLGLFIGGLLIGGVDAVDSREDRLWFLAQVWVGPVAVWVDYAHQNLLKIEDERGVRRTPDPVGPNGERAAYSKSIGRINEIGALYCALAGLLNLIAIIDASWHTPRRRRGHEGGIA